MNDSSISMVRAWVDAINDRNANRLSELSSSDMKFTGTRGSGHGIKLVLDWLARVALLFILKEYLQEAIQLW